MRSNECVALKMKFLGQSFPTLEPEQDKHTQTVTDTDRWDRTHYHVAFSGGEYCWELRRSTFRCSGCSDCCRLRWSSFLPDHHLLRSCLSSQVLLLLTLSCLSCISAWIKSANYSRDVILMLKYNYIVFCSFTYCAHDCFSSLLGKLKHFSNAMSNAFFRLRHVQS